MRDTLAVHQGGHGVDFLVDDQIRLKVPAGFRVRNEEKRKSKQRDAENNTGLPSIPFHNLPPKLGDCLGAGGVSEERASKM
jgi:hypothetical protein